MFCHAMSCSAVPVVSVRFRSRDDEPGRYKGPLSAWQDRAGQGDPMRCVMRCHVPPRYAPLRRPRRRSAFRILHVAPPSHFVPFAPPLACLRRDPVFARIACARVRAFRAGAHVARLMAHARAKRRAHFSRPFRWGFFAPARGGRRSGPRLPLHPVSFYHGFHRIKLDRRIYFKSSEQIIVISRRRWNTS